MAERIKQGNLVIAEGVTGAGKSLQLELLRHRDILDGWMFSREPGGTSLGEHARWLVQKQDEFNVHPEASVLGYTMSRAQLVNELIIPSRKAGKSVILDRYFPSTFAFQGAEGVSKWFILAINLYVTRHAKPDLFIYYDIDPAEGLNRKSGSFRTTAERDRYEEKRLPFHYKARDNYKLIAKFYPRSWKTINAGNGIEQVHKETVQLLKDTGMII